MRLGSLALGQTVVFSDLAPSSRQISWAINDVEGIAFYSISPMDFLRLTTKSEAEIKSILAVAKDMKFYSSPEIRDELVVHPFLLINDDGKIVGHEGRHRAAATHKSEKSSFEIAIVAREAGWPVAEHGWRWKRNLDVPNTLKGQFQSFTHSVNKGKLKPIKREA